MFIINALAAFGNWFWGLPILIVVIGGDLYISIRLGFIQIRKFGYVLSQTFGTMFKKSEKKDGVSSFAAACAALAASVGASNIVGVPVAIALGGPGAVFWIWLIALVGCATKYVEVSLGVKYREKNDAGEWVGGPFYYLRGLGAVGKVLGYIYAVGLMLELVPSIASQCLSATDNLQVFGIPQHIAGIILAVLALIIIVGGFGRITHVMDLMVPIMAALYIVGALVVIIANIGNLLPAIGSIFAYAFRPVAAVGGFAGSTVALAIRWGAARGVYSNEAGFGTAPAAHASADVDHPIRQACWGIFEVTVDTLVVCTVTALAVLVTGAWQAEGVATGAMAQYAFTSVFGSFGTYFVAVCVFLFVFSTIVVCAYYGQRQAEFLFGLKFSKIWVWIYPIFMVVAAMGAELTLMFMVTDGMLGLVIVPNMLACILLVGQVKKLQDEYFNTPDQYYLADKAAKAAAKAAK